MRYDLSEIITRNAGPQRRPMALRTIVPTQAMAGDLARLIVRVPRLWHEIATGRVLDAYAASIDQLPNGLTRDAPSDIQRELDLGEEDVRRLMIEIGPQVKDWVGGVDAWHRSKFIASVLSASGVDLTTVVGAQGQTAEAFFESILALIRNIDDSTRNRIAGVVWRGFTERTPRREMARLITEQTNIERKRALRIASDQTVKLAAKLDQARQEDAGIEEYVWRHSRKLHPRLNHVARDGKIFRWDTPPEDGPPGTQPNCGCKPQAHVTFD